MNSKKIIATAATAAGIAFPVQSLYNSGQDNRGFLNTTVHLGAATAVGAGAIIGGNALSGGTINDVAKSIAKGIF